ncbi:hypothetical protein KC345_g8814 [Hortaea werneckii]|nr:hypothetical protein KC345_g8814 [Hortaea werneckii]
MDSIIGPLTLCATEAGLCQIRFGTFAGTADAIRQWVKTQIGPAAHICEDAQRLSGAHRQLTAYFAGQLQSFDLPLDMRGTVFQRQVWEALLSVPYGESASYKEIAVRIGNPQAVRAVGGANNRNPVPMKSAAGAEGGECMGGVKEYVNGKVSVNREQIEYHVEKILELIGEDTSREGLLETPARVTRMYEEIFGGYSIDPREALGITFDESHEELVIVKDIVYYSQCEHHMAPFFGKVHIGYVPSGRIAGLSKLARLVEAVSRRLQVQERITAQIADIMTEVLNPHGVMVVVEGEHLCMCARGVKKPGSKTVTMATRGTFREDAAARAEFLALIKE